jgi:Domain of unknown function (DUF397)
MLNENLSAPKWRKSSFSEAGNCVEVAIQEGGRLVLIRDSKNPNEGILAVSASAWQEFIHAILSNGIT